MAEFTSKITVRGCGAADAGRRRVTGRLLLSGASSLALLVGCSGEAKPDDAATSDAGVVGETTSNAPADDTSEQGPTSPGNTTRPGTPTRPGGTNTPGTGGPAPGTGGEPDDTGDGETTNVTPPNGTTTDPDVDSEDPTSTGNGDDTGPVVIPNDGELRAFPGATGFGAMATGGRGGQVIKVTTLAESGPGSFRDAIATPGPRIIVFAVSGVIESDEIFEIYSGDVTIAGQTAPGGGITIKGRLFAAYDESVGNIVMRHVRVRPGFDGSEGSQFDAIQFSVNHDIIFDHVSVGFGVDETMDFYSAQRVTVQWSTVEDPVTEGHEEGEHNYGLINGPYGRHIAVHHNLFAHAKNRNPAIANGPADILNNVMYDVGVGFVHHNPASGQFRLLGNYFKDGPSAELIPFYFDDYALDGLEYYIADNWVEGEIDCEAGELDNPWQQCGNYQDHDESYRANSDFDFSDVEGYRPTVVTSAEQAYDEVMAKVGAFPRDVVTRRAIADLRDGTGEWGMPMPDDLMEGLTPTEPPADADDDGMADSWETSHGLDPADGDDHSTVMESGYTAIEEYINELAERLIQ